MIHKIHLSAAIVLLGSFLFCHNVFAGIDFSKKISDEIKSDVQITMRQQAPEINFNGSLIELDEGILIKTDSGIDIQVCYLSKSGENITSLGTDAAEDIILKYSAKSKSEDNKTGKGIVALFLNERFVKACVEEVVFDGAERYITISKPTADKGYIAKVFLFQNLTDIQPLMEALMLPNKYPTPSYAGKKLIYAKINFDETDVKGDTMISENMDVSEGDVTDVIYYPGENTAELVFADTVSNSVNVTVNMDGEQKRYDNIGIENSFLCEVETPTVSEIKFYPINDRNAVLRLSVYNPLTTGENVSIEVSGRKDKKTFGGIANPEENTQFCCIVDLSEDLIISMVAAEGEQV